MKILKPRYRPDTFFPLLAEAPARALLLDYDGTLAPFRLERDEAVPYPGVREALDALIEAGHTRTAVISGRATQDLLPLLGLRHTPEIWGTHGWERLGADGRYRVASLPPAALEALEALVARLGKAGLEGRWERKPASVALHWRGLPEAAAGEMREEMVSFWEGLADRSRLALKPFDGGIELSVVGRDKGFAVRTILEELGSDAVVAYLGDDLTDEDAFAALGESGLSVLVRGELRETAADWWLEPPGELLNFLERWHAACGKAP